MWAAARPTACSNWRWATTAWAALPARASAWAAAAAALAGAGIAALWAAYRRGGWRAWLLPVVLLGTAAWQVKLLADYPAWSAWLAPLLLGGSGLAVGGLVVANLLRGRIGRRM